MVDVEKRYIEKDGICEDVVEEMRIEIGEDDNDSDDDDGDELMDDNNRQLIDRTLQQTTLPPTETCTNPRWTLADSFKDYEPLFWIVFYLYHNLLIECRDLISTAFSNEISLWFSID